MTTVALQPHPLSHADHYYVPQYHHCTCYGPPPQYSLHPSETGTFYTGPAASHYPASYHPCWYHSPDSPSVPAPVATASPPYYPGQTVYSISCPMVVRSPQHGPPAKRERKIIRIRDPRQGGRDITEEVLAWGSWSRSSTPPVGSPSSTSTPPQQLSSSQMPEEEEDYYYHYHHHHHDLQEQQQWQPPHQLHHPSYPHQPHQVHPVVDTWEPPLTAGASDSKPEPEHRPEPEPFAGLVPPGAPVERHEAAAHGTDPLSIVEPDLSSPSSTATLSSLPLSAFIKRQRLPLRESTASSSSPSSSGEERVPSSALPHGLHGPVHVGTGLDAPAHTPSPRSPASLPSQQSAPVHRHDSSSQTSPTDGRTQILIAAGLAAAAADVVVVSVPANPRPAPALPDVSPGLPPLVWATPEADRPSRSTEAKDRIARTGPEEHGGVTDSPVESRDQALVRESLTEAVNQKMSALPKTRRRKKYRRREEWTSCSVIA